MSQWLELERGYTRGGRRFAQGNVAHYSSISELLLHHEELLKKEAAFTSRVYRIGKNEGNLIQSTLRYSIHHKSIKESLLDQFSRLFAEHNERRNDHYEVTVTFNAILSNAQGTSFSLFYGQDFRAGNVAGAAPELRYGVYYVRTLGDVDRLPVTFDFDRLAEAHKYTFEDSGVHIARFLNIIYLAARFVKIKTQEM